MKRQIMFRAWDNADKKWLAGYEHESLGGFSLWGEVILLGEWSNILNEFLFGKSEKSSEDLIIMQFTGLYDKNGKACYEGDVIKWGNDEQGVVEWRGNGFWVYDDVENFMPKSFEIVGNIHENPDLAH